MIRFRLTELLAERSFKSGQRIELQDVAEGSGVHRTTLSRMINVRGYNLTVNNLDALCRFFGCQLGEIAEYVADESVAGEARKLSRDARPLAERAQTKAKAPGLKSKLKKRPLA